MFFDFLRARVLFCRFTSLVLALLAFKAATPPLYGATTGPVVFGRQKFDIRDFDQGFTKIAAAGNHTLAVKDDGTVIGWGDDWKGQSTIPAGLTNVIGIAAGTNHGVALKNDGTLVTWGDNGHGQSAVPPGLNGVVAISSSGLHTVALKNDGTVAAWGYNYYGQASVPEGLTDVAAISAGGNHTLAIKNDGTLVGWGRNQWGQASVPAGVTTVIAIAAGGDYSVAVKSDGTVVTWGYDAPSVPADLTGVVSVATGYGHVLALKSDGTVVAWGDNRWGQGASLPGLTGVTAIAAGDYHSVVLKSDGTVVAWGNNSQDQATTPEGLSGITKVAGATYFTVGVKTDGTPTGFGPSTWSSVPVDLSNVSALADGGDHMVALKNDGTVVAWGSNAYGQLNVPPGLSGVIAISAYDAHTLALKNDGTVVGWGDNWMGSISIPAELAGVTAIATGGSHSLAVKDDGTVVAWGRPNEGQTAIPVGLSNVIAVAAGSAHSLALKSDGTVVAWGSPDQGQTTVPAGLSGVIAIDAGVNFSAALKSDGTVVLWGDSYYGQLRVPANLTGVSKISANAERTVTVVSYPAPPKAVTLPATSLSAATATLQGSVNANNQETVVEFEYGETAAYGSTIAATQSPVSGSATTSVNVPLTGFAGHRTYHYRVKATNVDGTVFGSDRTFTTPNTPPAVEDDTYTYDGAPMTLNVLANDSDFDSDNLTILGVSQGTVGVVSTNGTTITYTLGAVSAASDSFTYTVSDGFGGTATATVTIQLMATATDPAIQTGVPVTMARLWHFTAKRANDLDGLTLRVQYADAGSPTDWADLPVANGTNSMTPPAQGDDTWSLAVSPLPLPAGYYFFRIVATAPGRPDGPSDSFGAEALGGNETGAIVISEPGSPPPPPPLTPMPATSKLAVQVFDTDPRSSATRTFTTSQGSKFGFLALQPTPLGTPEIEEIRVQYSTTPANAGSWQNVDDGELDFVEKTKTARSYRGDTDHVPSGTGIYFRTLTSGKGRGPAPGPVIKGVVVPVGPFDITPGPTWDYVESRHRNLTNTQDNRGEFASVGDEIRYEISFENDGTVPATNVLVTMVKPPHTEIVAHESAQLKKASGGRIEWLIPQLQPGQEVVKFITVKVEAKPETTIVMPNANITVKCDQIPVRQAEPSLNAGQRRAGIKTLNTYVGSPLRLIVESNPSIAPAGGTVDYTLTATNTSGNTVTDAEATFRVPAGMCVEYLRLPNGNGDFTDAQFPNPSPTSNPSLEPYVIGERQLIRWQLGDIPAGAQRTMRFTLRVQFDIPSYYTANSISYTTTIAANDYSLVAKTEAGKTVKAFKKAPPEIRTLISAEEPEDYWPQLSLEKSAEADGHLDGDAISGTEKKYALDIPGIGNVSTAFEGSRIIYTLRYSNTWFGAARNVTIHDKIPDGVTFKGWIRKDGVLINSTLGFTFLNARGEVIPNGIEPFTDSNNSGKWEAGEPFTDTNGNRRYDETKFIQYNAGMLTGGASGEISYEVAATSKPGTLILSQSGGALVPKNKKTKLFDGFVIAAENLLQPVAGNPTHLASVVIEPAAQYLRSVVADTSVLYPGAKVSFEIPYGVTGAEGLQFKDVTVRCTIPQHYNLDFDGTGFVDVSVPIEPGQPRPLRSALSGETVQLGEPNSDGGRVLTFNLGGLIGGREGVLRATVTVANPMPAELLTQEGYVKAPLFILPEMNGKTSGGLAPTRTGRHRALGLVDVAMKPASRLAAVSPLAPQQADVFIGRVAPLSVKPGDPFDITIFFGNATDREAVLTSVAMQIPYGTEFVEASAPVLQGAFGADPTVDARLIETRRFNLLMQPYELGKKSGVIDWNIWKLPPHSAGIVTLKLRVRSDFGGNLIEDNSCYIKPGNASGKVPPKLTINVTQKNLFTEALNIFGNVVSNLFGGFPESVKQVFQNQPQTTASRNIGVSGAGFVHLTNGTVVVPMLGGRTLVVGPSSLVEAHPYYILADDGGARVTFGRGHGPEFQITGIDNPGAPVWTPGDIIDGLQNPGSSLVAAGAGNIVAAGGLNLVAAGGLNLVDNNSGAALATPLRPVFSNIVAAGGGNIVAAGGGNIVAAGAGNLISDDGSTLVAAGAGNLISDDGSTLVAAGGGNIVAAGAGNIVAAGGLNLLANDMSKLVGPDGGSLTAVAGAGLTQSQLAGARLVTTNMGGILSHNGALLTAAAGGIVGNAGGNIVAAGGLNLVAAGAGNVIVNNGGNIVGNAGGN